MTPSGLTLSELNRLPPQAFVAALGEVFEHAPWVAEAALPGRPYPTVAALHDGHDRGGPGGPGRPAARIHHGPPGAGQPGQAGRAHRRLAGRTGRARPRPAERRRSSTVSPGSTPPIGRNSAFPSSSACAGTPGTRSWNSSSGGSATTPRPSGRRALDEIGLITRLRLVGAGRRPRQAEDRRPALDPCARHRGGPSGRGRADRALRNRRERARAAGGNGHQRRRPHRRAADRGRAAADRDL